MSSHEGLYIYRTTDLQDFKPYLAVLMEYYPLSLYDFIYGMDFPIKILKLIIIGIIKGVQTLHNNGITHCDIKPENVGLNMYLKPTILDFGLSFIVGSEPRKGFCGTS